MSLGQCSPETLLGATDPGKSSIKSVDPETGHSKFKFEEVIVSNGSVYNGLFVLKKKCRYLTFKNTTTLQIIKSSQISCVVGLGLLLNGDETTTNSLSYAASCCGFIRRWSFKPKTAGTIEFQIWRPTSITGIYSLVGTNSYSVTCQI